MRSGRSPEIHVGSLIGFNLYLMSAADGRFARSALPAFLILVSRRIGLLMAKNLTHSHPYSNIIILISIPHPPQNIRRKLNPTHPIILLTPNQPVIEWKLMGHGNPVGSAYCLTSSQLHTHTLIHNNNFICSFNDIKKHSPRHKKIVTIILYTDTKTSLVDEHLGLEKITKNIC
jgi:hypothetical protein